jgi:hypothetical protein
MYIELIEDMPKEALAAIQEEWDAPAETVEDIIEGIRDAWNYEETTDSCYITRSYSVTIGDEWRLEVDGNSYRKDMSVCEEEMDDGFTLTDLAKERKSKERAKNAKRAKSDENWRKLFSSIDGSVTPEKAFEMMKDYKFPTKWAKQKTTA